MTQTNEERLRRAGLRVTAPRLAVLGALSGATHLGVDEIVRIVRSRLGSVSVQAIYEIVHVFTTAGLVRRIEPAGSPARYETRVGDNHHHVVCRGCGRIADVDCARGRAPCMEPAATAGFVIDKAEVTFWGWCPDCGPGRGLTTSS